MRQTWHIFSKDVFHLWPQIVLTLAIAILFATYFSRPISRIGDLVPFLLIFSLPATYIWLIVSLVHQEPLPGERQFWVTRPYSVASLFLAKTLFIAIFLSGVLLLKDCAIVAAHGFAVAPLFGGILLRTLAWTIWIGLTAFAAASITKNIQQLAIFGSTVGLLVVFTRMLFGSRFDMGLDWVGATLATLSLVIFDALILAWQYRRRTFTARILAVCCVALLVIGLPVFSRNAVFPVQERFFAGHPTTVTIRPDHNDSLTVTETRLDNFILQLPIEIVGPESGLSLSVDGLRASAVSDGLKIPLTTWQSETLADVALQKVALIIDKTTFRAIKDQLTAIELSLSLTVFQKGKQFSISPHQTSFQFEGMHCERRPTESGTTDFSCTAAVNPAPHYFALFKTLTDYEGHSEIGTRWTGPFHTMFDLVPVEVHPILAPAVSTLGLRESLLTWDYPDTDYILTPLHPVAHFRREITFQPVRLADHLVPERPTQR